MEGTVWPEEKIPVGISIAVLKENAEQLPRLVDSIARSNPEVDRLLSMR